VKRVPFKRELHYPMGRNNPQSDIVALQRALRRGGFRPRDKTGAPKGFYGKKTRAQVRAFQAARGIKGDRGVVKENTWRHLNELGLFDGYDHYLVGKVKVGPPKPPMDDKIARFVKVAWWYLGHAPLDYYQQRPMFDTAPPPNVDTSLDCSEFVYVCAQAAGLPDPSGYSPQYQGWGNTYSFLDHMPSPGGPRVGDLAFYSDPSHVVIIAAYSSARGFSVISMGGDGGPRYLPLTYRNPSAYRTFKGMK
jgi:putative peptidoglycan binding protein